MGMLRLSLIRSFKKGQGRLGTRRACGLPHCCVLLVLRRKIQTDLKDWACWGPLPLSLGYCRAPHRLGFPRLPRHNQESSFWNAGLTCLKFSITLLTHWKRGQLELRHEALHCFMPPNLPLPPLRTSPLCSGPTKHARLGCPVRHRTRLRSAQNLSLPI